MPPPPPPPPHLLTALLPSDVLRELCAEFLHDVRDLMRLCDADPAVLAELQMVSREWRFRARRILSEEELQWLAARRLAVKLLEEMKVLETGRTEWRRNGVLHRGNDLPAVEYLNVREWWWEGQMHRENDLPARVYLYANGTRYWFWKGKRHRGNDLPAIEWPDGSREWWWQDELHRDNEQPAVVRSSGACAWFTHGVLGAARGGRIDYNAQPVLRMYDGTLVFGPRTDGGPSMVFLDGTRVWGEFKNSLRIDFFTLHYAMSRPGTWIFEHRMTPRIICSGHNRRLTAYGSDGQPILNPAKHKRAVQTFLRQQAVAAAEAAAAEAAAAEAT